MFFCLDTKEPKNQDCKILAKNCSHFAKRIELAPKLFKIFRDFGQQFSLAASFVYSFNANILRSWEKYYEEGKGFKKSGAKCGREV